MTAVLTRSSYRNKGEKSHACPLAHPAVGCLPPAAGADSTLRRRSGQITGSGGGTVLHCIRKRAGSLGGRDRNQQIPEIPDEPALLRGRRSGVCSRAEKALRICGRPYPVISR